MKAIRTIRRDDWEMILEKEVIIRDFCYRDMPGKISLMEILKAAVPFSVRTGETRVTIVDDGYSWVQIAPEGAFFWITSMFDEDDCLIQIYIDITDGNVTDVPDPYFADMYLDYVVHGDSIIELDREELTAAYENGIITREQYERSLAEGDNMLRYLRHHRGELADLLSREQQRMKKRPAVNGWPHGS